MFNTKKFGAYISWLRKNANWTQSELAEMLNLTRQAISKYEIGDSFPDISILMLISELFGITLDTLINSGDLTKGEAEIFKSVAADKYTPIKEIPDIVNLAPLLKQSILNKMADGLSKQGIDISSVVTIAEYINDEGVIKLLESATFDTINDELLEKLIPFLDEKSKNIIFEKILEGKLDYHLIKIMLPYAEYLTSQIEAAVVYGVLDKEALEFIRNYVWRTSNDNDRY